MRSTPRSFLARRSGRPSRPALTVAVLSLAALLGLVGVLSGSARAQGPDRVTLDFQEGTGDSLEIGTAPNRAGEYRVRSGDVVRFGESIVIEADERVRGDVVAIGGSIRVRGYVDGDVVSVGGSVILEDEGEVRGEAISVGGHVEEHGRGKLRGSSVTLPGKRDWNDWAGSRRFHKDSSSGFPGALVWLGILLLLGWLATRLAPARLAATRERIHQNPLTSFLWGLGAFVLFVPALVAVVFAVVLLCITVIGIPLGIALLFAYFIGFALLLVAGFLAGSSAIGEWLSPRLGKRVGSPTEVRVMVLGILAGHGLVTAGKLLKAVWVGGALFSGLGTFLVVIGCIVSSLAIFLGAGALLATGGGWVSLRWERRGVSRASPLSGPPSAPPEASPPSPPAPPALTGS